MHAHTWLSLSAAGSLSLTCRPPILIDPLGRLLTRDQERYKPWSARIQESVPASVLEEPAVMWLIVL